MKPIPSRGHRLVRRKTVSHITVHEPPDPQAPTAFSKVSVKSQTVIPRAVRERLALKPGDTLRYRVTDNGVLLDKAPANETDDPFASFLRMVERGRREGLWRPLNPFDIRPVVSVFPLCR